MANKKNPFAGKVKQGNKKKPSGKRIGKSKPDKANNARPKTVCFVSSGRQTLSLQLTMG